MQKSLTIGDFLADYSMETTEYRDKLELVSTDQTVIEDFMPRPGGGGALSDGAAVRLDGTYWLIRPARPVCYPHYNSFSITI